MAGASDKARFYLEQSVPELREWERREIFTKEEITAIASKRSDFEHILNARGSQPSDYARYAEYEINLDALRRKRVKRKGVKATAHTGQQRIFLILDRATRKFHGDVGLWMQYIDFARKQRANKKLTRILTEVLRMHPTKPDLWIYAARYAVDVQADIQSARSYLQRGLRFCKTSRAIYLEYARLEMGYIAKIAARHKVLGLDSAGTDSSKLDAITTTSDDTAADMIELPAFTADVLDMRQSRSDLIDDSNVNKLVSTPAMTGAIPLAIFDAAMKQFQNDEVLGEKFFNMFADFGLVPCTQDILQHVVETLNTISEFSTAALSCRCRISLVGVSPHSLQFPSAIRQTLKHISTSLAKVPDGRISLSEKILSWLSPLAQTEDLAPELQKVLSATVRQLSKEP